MAINKTVDVESTTSGESKLELASNKGNAFKSAQTSFPNFSALGQVHKIPSKNAARLNAAHVDKEELAALHEERGELVDKILAKSATARDLRRLEYVRWSLDRIEDAIHGEHLDEMEGWVERMEFFAKNLAKFENQLVSQMRGKSNRYKKNQ